MPERIREGEARTMKFITITVLVLLAITFLLPPGCSKETDRIVDIDWVDFIKFNDITYVRKIVPLDAFAKEDLKYYDKTKFKLANNVDYRNYQGKNGLLPSLKREHLFIR